MTSNLLHAQNGNFEAQNILESSISIQKSGMLVLGSWAALNILSGIPGSLTLTNERKYFHQMNLMWNVVNFGIATFGYLGVENINEIQSANEVVSELKNFDRILLINAGLDLGYIGMGAWLWNKGSSNSSSRLLGFGKSVVLQGGFLLLFDSILYLVHHHQTESISVFGGELSLTFSGFSFAF